MSKERDESCLMTHPVCQVRLGRDLRYFSILKTATTPLLILECTLHQFLLYPVIKTAEGGADRPETGLSTSLMWHTLQTTISCTIIMAQKSFFSWKMLFERWNPHACLFLAVFTNDTNRLLLLHSSLAAAWVQRSRGLLMHPIDFYQSVHLWCVFLKLYQRCSIRHF